MQATSLDVTNILWGLAKLHLQQPHLHMHVSLIMPYAVRCLSPNAAVTSALCHEWAVPKHIAWPSSSAWRSHVRWIPPSPTEDHYKSLDCCCKHVRVSQ